MFIVSQMTVFYHHCLHSYNHWTYSTPVYITQWEVLIVLFGVTVWTTREQTQQDNGNKTSCNGIPTSMQPDFPVKIRFGELLEIWRSVPILSRCVPSKKNWLQVNQEDSLSGGKRTKERFNRYVEANPRVHSFTGSCQITCCVLNERKSLFGKKVF